MPAFSKVALFSSLIAFAAAQQVGTNTAEVHPALTSYQCTSSGCTAQSTKIVIDANWRWLHGTGGYTNCYTGNKWDTTLCPDDVTCASNCALEGADYAATYGITTSGNALTLKFVTKSSGTNIGSRVFLMDTDTSYLTVNLKNSEFTMDVDVSNLPCGLNGAVYFVEMDKDGGMAKYPTNKAGAKYGTGYCDSQCPHDLKMIAGKANVEGWSASSTDSNAGSGTNGSCCSEMDIWEANSISAAYTPHVCQTTGLLSCTGVQCGDGDQRYKGVCDKDGCDFNSFRQGDKTFYGPGLTVDTKSKFTVVTQFITSDGTQAGDLTEIRRFYVQGGKVIANSKNTWAGIDKVNSITDAYCTQQKATFGDTPYQLGGLKAMGESLARGHVLTMSLWDDHAVNLLWLDAPYPASADPSAPGISRGTCSDSSGVPSDLESSVPNSSVTYSNIKFGPLGSTFSDPSNIAGSLPKSNPGGSAKPATTTKAKTTTTSTKTTKKKTTTTSSKKKKTTTTVATTTKSTTAAAPTTTAASTGPGAGKYGQCGGGSSWTGPTTCQSGLKCTVLNPYYSQCL